ncbi:hypothetical protein MTR67_020592 [Solanum verrucosum]|uniref:Uncharacterized protein n=1 Tax=Solanum verrucosum TaxID=315347 RepID=A0AAF0QNK8_SOLVR|nr:hypothetical protein MTR67_020592 [Solanum verrucosum]
MGELIKTNVPRCFDDILTSAGTWSSAEYEYSSSVKVLNSCKTVRVRKLLKLQSTSPIRSDEISESSLKSPGRPDRGFTPLSKEALNCGGDIPIDSADDIEELKEVDLQKLRMS